MSDNAYTGYAVINRGTDDAVVRFFSVTALERADMERDGGCLRKWWYRYIGGIKDEGTKQKTIGIDGHEQIATYLRTGVDVLGPYARTAKSILPKPGPDLDVELALAPSLEVSGPEVKHRLIVDLEAAPLRLAGVPVVGNIDVRHQRGYHVGGIDLAEAFDPDGTFEVGDHKFSSRPDLAITPEGLKRSLQMIGYAEHGRLTIPGAKHARLSHHVINTSRREAARKVTTRLPIAQIEDTWRSWEPLARSIQQAAKAPRAEDVTPNVDACGAYGGCPHQQTCSASRGAQLVKLFGKRTTMSLLDDIPDTDTPEAPAVPADFTEACAYIDAAANTYGLPKFEGQAAQYRATLQGKSIPVGASLPGSGRLAGKGFSDPGMIVKLGADLRQAGVKLPAPKVAAPPPALVVEALPAEPAPVKRPGTSYPPAAVAAVQDLAMEIGLLPPDAPQQQTYTPPAPPPAEVAGSITLPVKKLDAAEPEAPKAKRGKSKAATAPAGDVTPGEPSHSAPEIVILANAYTVGAQSLDAMVAGWVAEIAKQVGVDDIRLATGDGNPCAFGRWKGILGAMARDGIAALPPGWYVLDSGSDFGLVTLEAAAGLSGVRVVRGAR